jgi:hypothetical protein
LTALALADATALASTDRAAAQLKPSPYMIVNGGEHAWVLDDPR